jgi:putative component of toxin-antitoxin plasmid stabilization module
MVTIKQYIARDGKSPFERWFDALNEPAAARVLTAIRRIEYGNFSSVTGVGEGVFESASTLALVFGCISARTGTRW